MAGVIDFSTGSWVDTNGDGTPDSAAGSIWVIGGDAPLGNSYVAFLGAAQSSFSSGGSINHATTIIATAGIDWILMQNNLTAVTVYGGGGNDQISGGKGNDALYGGDGNDLIYDGGNTTKDLFSGEGGNDHIIAGESSGRMDGGGGDDLIEKGYAGKAVIDCGAGNDTVNAFYGIHAATISGGAGKDTLSVENDISTFTISGFETLSASKVVATRAQLLAFDHIDAGSLTVTTRGTMDLVDRFDKAANINLHASNFGNRLIGGPNSDYLIGGKGNDVLVGRGGSDFLTGGNGKDHFVFDTKIGGPNSIVDFEERDVIELDHRLIPGSGGSNHSLKSGFFSFGSAHDGNDHIIYDGQVLFYDSNGNRAGGMKEICSVGGPVSADDIFVI